MNWTKRPPTEPGYYWWRYDLTTLGYIVRVTGRLAVEFTGWSGVQRSVADAGGEWRGPLQQPGGDAVENCAEVPTDA